MINKIKEMTYRDQLQRVESKLLRTSKATNIKSKLITTSLQAIVDHHLPKQQGITSLLLSTYISNKSSGMTIRDLAPLTQTSTCQVIK